MPDHDSVITEARIVDGCGNPWFWGDIGVRSGRIDTVAKPGSLKGKMTISAEGRFLTPGFIDVHTHSDLTLLLNQRAESAVRQGVTTQIIGNCGMSPAPVSEDRLPELRHYWRAIALQPEVTWQWRTFGDFLKTLEANGLGINIGALAGHGALRIAVMGFDDRKPDKSEMSLMQGLLSEAMADGAFGMSTGLVYPPGCFADTEEIISLCTVVAEHKGLYASHIRGERETILDAVSEAIRIGHEAGVPVQISHNAPKFGAPCDAKGNLTLVEEARARGQDVTVDNDVHTDLGVMLRRCLPQRYREKKIEDVIDVLKDSKARAQIRDDIIADREPAFGPSGLLKHGCWDRIVIMHPESDPDIVGKSIEKIAGERDKDPFDTYFDLIVENGESVMANFDYIDQSNIEILLKHPAVMITSDGRALALSGFLNDPPPYSPCSYGEYPGVLERYVRDKKVLTLEEAIRKMTSFPAQRFGLANRGIIRTGMQADLVVFDLDRIKDRATNLFPHTYPFENVPHEYPEGIDYVLVNGKVCVENAEHTGRLPGQILRNSTI